MRLLLVAVGKIKRPGLRAELDLYLKRIRRYAPCRELELKNGNARDIEERIRRLLPARSHTVVLDVKGQLWSSHELAGYLDRCRQGAVGTLVLLVGGADGLPASLVAAAQLRLSLSRLTLPHRLARVVLAEQLYRAFTSIHNEPYNH